MPEDSPGGEAGDENDAHPPPDVGSWRDQSATDTLYRLLADERRRQLLSFLSDRAGEPVSVDRLVDEVAENERPDPGPANHRDRVAIDLHHVHLPKLADTGVVEHDPLDGTVTYEGPESIAILLDAADEIEHDDS